MRSMRLGTVVSCLKEMKEAQDVVWVIIKARAPFDPAKVASVEDKAIIDLSIHKMEKALAVLREMAASSQEAVRA